MSSAIGAVFAYLNAQIPAAVVQVNSTAYVVDGPVAAAIQPAPAPMIYIGAQPTTGQALDGSRMYVNLGRMSVDEEFTVPCYIDAATGNADQAECRNSALDMYNAIVHLISSDLTLGGALLAGRNAEIRDVQMLQTETDDEADNGRRCLILFTVHCANHYTP